MTSRIFSVVSRLSVPKILWKYTPVNQLRINLIDKSYYHTSSVVLRKSGSSALEPKMRLPSAKQIKRKTREAIKNNATVDRQKEKLKIKHMKKQFETGEVQEFIENIREKMAQPTLNMLLPEGLAQIVAPIQEDELSLEPQVDPNETLALFESMKLLAEGKSQPLNDTFTKALVMNKDDNETITKGNLSIVALAKSDKVHKALHLFNLMEEMKVPVQQEAVNNLMKAAVRTGSINKADELFDNVAKHETLDLSVEMWSAKAEILCSRNDIPGAVALLDKLLKLSIRPESSMYSTILGAYVRTKDTEKAIKMWTRMHRDGVAINHEGFDHMFRLCFDRGEAERSFFYMDEMRVYGLEPTLTTFKNFFMAVSTAPHYVPGYQDTLFDAMAIMEGKEMIPNAEVYESLIYAFGRARDPVAAEYYFWEMIRKGIDATPAAYEHLLAAYKLAQSVGAKRYGTLGRYSRPAPKKLSPMHQALVDIGPVKAAELMNAGMYTDYTYDKNDGRVKKPRIEDMMDDSEGEEAFRQSVFAEAAAVRLRKGLPPPELASEEDIKYTQRLTAASEQALLLNSGDSNTQQIGAGDEDDEEWDAESLEQRFQRSHSFSRYDEVEEDVDEEFHENSDEYYEENGRREMDLDREDLGDLADGDMAFKELLTQIRDSNDGSFDGMELDGKPIKSKSSPAAAKKIVPEENRTEKKEFEIALAKLQDGSVESFEDPFVDCTSNRGVHLRVEDDEEHLEELARKEQELRKFDKIALLDSDVSTYERVETRAMAALAGDNTGRPSIQSAYNALARLDGAEVPAVSMQDIQDGYDLVYFGRPPNADYSAPLERRRRVNAHRAELAFQHMLDAGIKPTTKVLTNLCGVYSEAGWSNKAEASLALFDKHGMKATNLVYENLMTAYLRRKDLDSAHHMLAIMREQKIKPTSNTYGALMQACIQRNLVVESLKVLEEAAASNVKINERHLRHLRARCTSLGIKHPDIPLDPNQWVKDVKLVRRQQKNASQRVIEPIRNIRF